MRRRRVADVMTRDVVTVPMEAPFRQAVRILAERGVSGAPLVDANGYVVGIVTEGDLLGKQARVGDAAQASTWRRLWRKLVDHGATPQTAADFMSTPVITVQPGARLTTAAALLARHNIKRAPVVDTDGGLHGIISRKDLLSVYLRTDAELADEIRAEVLTRAMWVPPTDVTVEVSDGVATLRGKVERQSMIEVITALTTAVDGVVDVRNQLVADTDDTHIPPPPPENVGMLHPFTKH
ncbi:CBS domain-containing protein [Nocardia sp. NPDC052112]|uniref:CBS domain-containing protein n=1 Tax=Nocardia sp. NPDC052112 TaxID=3155646 RepID=UPI00342C77B1